MMLLITRKKRGIGDEQQSETYLRGVLSERKLKKDLGIEPGLIGEVIINKEFCRVSFIAPYDTKGHIVTDGSNMELLVNTSGPQIRLDYKLIELESRVSFISPIEEISFTTRE